jgi:hypothetical protein
VSTPSSVPGMTVSELSELLSVALLSVLPSETELVSVLEASLEELSLEHPTREKAIMAASIREMVLFFMFLPSFFGIFSVFSYLNVKFL